MNGREIPKQMLISKTKELINKNIGQTRAVLEDIREQLSNALAIKGTPFQSFDPYIEKLRNLHQAVSEAVLIIPKHVSYRSEYGLYTEEGIINCILTLKCIKWITSEDEIKKIFEGCVKVIKALSWIDETPVWRLISWESKSLGRELFQESKTKKEENVIAVKEYIARIEALNNENREMKKDLKIIKDRYKESSLKYKKKLRRCKILIFLLFIFFLIAGIFFAVMCYFPFLL